MPETHLMVLTPEEAESQERELSRRMVPSAYRDQPEEFKRITGLTWAQYLAKMQASKIDAASPAPVEREELRREAAILPGS